MYTQLTRLEQRQTCLLLSANLFFVEEMKAFIYERWLVVNGEVLKVKYNTLVNSPNLSNSQHALCLLCIRARPALSNNNVLMRVRVSDHKDDGIVKKRGQELIKIDQHRQSLIRQ